MKRPLLLYSASTWLAYSIAERFYGGIHYAWCSPVYDGGTAAMHVSIPPSSSPAEIYLRYQEETRRGDRHGQMIAQNLGGIQKGAKAKLAAGVISGAVHAEIKDITERADARAFRPVLFVMPFSRVRTIAREVPVGDRAHPLSVEYQIERLPRRCFDVIELRS